jgi:alpha-L-rhamnosidase
MPAIFLALMSFLPLAVFGAEAGLRPVDLRCEYLKSPLGIDSVRPRLGWALESTDPGLRGQAQSAFRILVASRRDLLDAGRGDLWDSGRVASDQSVHLRYGGKTLGSGQECHWKLRVWDQAGNVSPWSTPSSWAMGLLGPSDWKAQWIGKDETEPSSSLEGTNWIWHPEGEPAKAAPVATRFFRHAFALPGGRMVKSARFFVAGDNQCTVYVNGIRAGSGSNARVAADFEASDLIRRGRNVLAVSVRNTGEAPNPAGLIGLLRVEFLQGEPVLVPTGAEWKSGEKESDGWEQPGFDDGSWAAARVLGPPGIAPWNGVEYPAARPLPARHLRREFEIERKVRRATAYISGLGLSELYINGRRVGDHVLSPGLTDYPRRVFYVTHDVTAFLRIGRNAVGALLGNGRYFAPRTKVPTPMVTYGFPKLLFQLQIDFEGGGSASIVSDSGWKLTANGPIRTNNEYDGEDYDARMELAGWNRPGFDDSAWEKPQVVAAPGGTLAAQMIDPIRVTETLKPVALTSPRPGVYIFDMGQNLVGWCRLRVSGPRGTTVALRHAETLKPDGTLYLDNIRSAKALDTYTLKGEGTEVYEPRFTYHGFRFAELRGYPGMPDLKTLEARVVHDDLEPVGEWTSSDPLLNRIYLNVHWGLRGNYRSIPTDCPQRDERQGWLGDRSEESRSEAYMFRTGPLYAKWLQDMEDSQKESGSVPDVCPAYWPFYNDNVTWPSSTVIIPNHLYELLGDTGLLERHYPSMQKWIEYMSRFLEEDLLARDNYGDWCVPPEDPGLIHSKDPLRKTAKPVLGTAYFHHCLELMTRYAVLLGREGDARRYRDLGARLREALNRKFLDRKNAAYDNGSQTSSLLPLAFDLVPLDVRAPVFERLVDKIVHESYGHVGTGLIGSQWLMRTLTRGGKGGLALAVATQKTYPSWGYMIDKGATTIWELWNGDTADPAMNSGNHVMLVGDLVTWLYEDLAGIRPDPARPGFKHIILKPEPAGDLREVRARHRSLYGWIESAWRREDGMFRWSVTVPPNTTATLLVPAGSAAAVQEGERPARGAPGLKFQRYETGRAVFEALPGRYSLRAKN